MFSALYFPHTQLSTSEVAGQRILKRALLMWDELEFIVPYPGFTSTYSDPLVAEAIELIGVNHCPSQEEKAEAHDRIEEFVTRPNLPDVFYYTGTDPASAYEMYPKKLLPKTWKLLNEAEFSGDLLPNADYPLSRQAGHTVMAILADCCAGETRTRVTDRAQAYASLTGLLADNPESKVRDRLVDATLLAGREEEALISLRLSLLEIDNLSLDKLISFRKREDAESGNTLRDLRHGYLKRIEDQVKELTTNPKLTKSDVENLERKFFEDSMGDLARLNKELWQEQRDAVLSKDVLVTIMAAIGTFASAVLPGAQILQGVLTATGAPVMIGGVVSAGNKFMKARANILRENPMALIHELNVQ